MPADTRDAGALGRRDSGADDGGAHGSSGMNDRGAEGGGSHASAAGKTDRDIGQAPAIGAPPAL
jgi:hypothetical protein